MQRSGHIELMVEIYSKSLVRAIGKAIGQHSNTFQYMQYMQSISRLKPISFVMSECVLEVIRLIPVIV